ncbi:MAG: DMT family transporter [Caulobacteraceae bacterium]|nr:DMT family transporter [Caulobacteraceae bacterium]
MPRAEGSRLAAVLALILGACAIAFSPIFVRLTGTGPAAAGFWRLSLALPGLALLAAQDTRKAGRWRAPSATTLAAGVFFALDLGFWHYGVKLASVADATILANLAPVWVTGGAWLLLRERPANLFLAGLLLAVAGAAVVGAAAGGGRCADPSLGDALSAISAFWYAGYLLIVRLARRSLSASEVMLWSSLTGAPLLLGFAELQGEAITPPNLAGWLACAGLGAVHVFGQGAISWSLGRIPAAAASVIMLIQPALAALLAWLIFAEPMTGLEMEGAVLVLAGVALAQLAVVRRG